MSHISPLRRGTFVGFVLATVCVLSAGLTAGQFSWLVGDKNITYQPFKDPAGRFELEYPNKDWKRLTSGGSSLAVFVHKDGPTLFIDHLRLDEPLTTEEIGAMPEAELTRLKEQQPKVKEFKADTVESKAGRGLMFRYARVGTEPEFVMQLSILVGQQDLYRLNGIVSDKLRMKHESTIMHMIQSFVAHPDPATAKG